MPYYSRVRVIEETGLETPLKRGPSLEVQGSPDDITSDENGASLSLHVLVKKS